MMHIPYEKFIFILVLMNSKDFLTYLKELIILRFIMSEVCLHGNDME